jgi:hypothetical protein
MAWPLIQIPKNDTFISNRAAAVGLAYPLLQTMGYLADWRIFLALSLHIFLEILEGQ